MTVPVWMLGVAFLGGVGVTLLVLGLIKVFTWLGMTEEQFYT